MATYRYQRERLLIILVALALSWAKLTAAADVSNTVTVTVVKAEGFCMPAPKTVGSDPGAPPTEWQGFIPDVVREIGKQAGFVPQFHEVADGRYGAFEEATGNWSGLIGEVLAGKADFAAAALTVTAQREKHIDFSHELLDVGLVTLVKRPERLSPVSRSAAFFIGIFDAGVWAAAVAAFLATSFLLYVNDRFNPRENQAKVAEHVMAANAASASPFSQFTLFGSAFYVMSTGCFQGYIRAPRSLAGRCLSLFWWLFACIFAATYIAGFLCGLIASGSSPDNKFAYMDARDQYKLDKNAMKAIVPVWLPGGSTEALMRNSSEPLFRLFYDLHAAEAKNNPRLAGVKNITDVLNLVGSAHHYVGILESTMADYYAKKSGCQLVVAGTLLSDRSYAFAFPEHSNLTGRVNRAVLKLRESGYIRQAYRRYFGGPFVPCGRDGGGDGQAGEPTVAAATLGLASEEVARMFRDSLPISLRTFAGPVALYFLSLLLSGAAALLDLHIFTRIERHQHSPQVLRNIQEPIEEPSLSTLAFSDEQRQRQEQRQQQQQEGDGGDPEKERDDL